MRTDALTSDGRWRIRNALLNRAPSYSRQQFARKAGVKPSSLEERAYSWEELAEAIMRRFPLAQVLAALEGSAIVPEGLRLERVELALPRYQVAMMRELAGRDGFTVDEWLQRRLREIARASDVPVSAEARDFPCGPSQ